MYNYIYIYPTHTHTQAMSFFQIKITRIQIQRVLYIIITRGDIVRCFIVLATFQRLNGPEQYPKSINYYKNRFKVYAYILTHIVYTTRLYFFRSMIINDQKSDSDTLQVFKAHSFEISSSNKSNLQRPFALLIIFYYHIQSKLDNKSTI